MLPTNNLQQQKHKFPELDCLRGIAVLVVMFFHYTLAYDTRMKIFDEKKFYLYHGNLAVHMFFIISGFVIFMTINVAENKFDFIVSRFSRLYPAYWVSMILTLLFLYYLPVATLHNFTLKDILINATMLEGFFKVDYIDHVYWTLKIELSFYTIMYALFLLKLLNKINFICAAWLVLAAISGMVNFPLKKIFDGIFILEYAPLFIAGIIFYKIKTSKGSNLFNNILVMLTLPVEIVWLLKKPAENLISAVIIVIIYFVFFIFSYHNLKFIINRFFLFFGSISYSLYLIHQFIGFGIIHLVRRYITIEPVYLLIPAMIVTLLAVLISKFVERPMITLIRSKYKLIKGNSQL